MGLANQEPEGRENADEHSGCQIFPSLRNDGCCPSSVCSSVYAANYDKATNQLAHDYMTKSAATDQQLVALREKYVPLFEKVASLKKTALWYQIDRRLDLMINLQLTALMPLVDPTK